MAGLKREGDRKTILGLALAMAVCAGAQARAWTPADLFAPCEDDCAFSIFGGNYVENSLSKILVTQPRPPTSWTYRTEDHLIGTAVSRRAGTLWGHVDIEPELGIGQRFGRQDVTEVWGAVFFRYHGFPWDDYVVTTVALSTGLNYASGISDIEQDRASDEKGSRLMHYLAPEVTFAAPSVPGTQIFFRLHHRSGAFGVVSDAGGGAQYGTIGVRIWF